MTDRHRPAAGYRPYITGFVLALVLTAIPFTLVAVHTLPPTETFIVIAVCAFAQIVVHLRSFLHLHITQTPLDTLLLLAFSAILIVLMVGGSLWIMFDLHARMTGF